MVSLNPAKDTHAMDARLGYQENASRSPRGEMLPREWWCPAPQWCVVWGGCAGRTRSRASSRSTGCRARGHLFCSASPREACTSLPRCAPTAPGPCRYPRTHLYPPPGRDENISRRPHPPPHPLRLQIKKWYLALTAASAIATLAFTCLALAVWKSIPSDAFEVNPRPTHISL